MWVPAVRPEEEQPVEQRVDVGHVGLPFRKDPEDAAVLLIIANNNNKEQWNCFTKQPRPVHRSKHPNLLEKAHHVFFRSILISLSYSHNWNLESKND